MRELCGTQWPQGPSESRGNIQYLTQQFPDEMREFANYKKSCRVYREGLGWEQGIEGKQSPVRENITGWEERLRKNGWLKHNGMSLVWKWEDQPLSAVMNLNTVMIKIPVLSRKPSALLLAKSDIYLSLIFRNLKI